MGLRGLDPAELPPGPSAPSAWQTAWWILRPIPFAEECRRRYGHTFTTRLTMAPPTVHLCRPQDVQELFVVAPDVLHPGEGAWILRPIVGRHSVLLADEDEHLEQRKLMLPAFHGERMTAMTGLLEEIAEREVAAWPRGEPVALHPRLQALTLEVIMRAVFGVGEGPRLSALRETLTVLLALGVKPSAMLPLLQIDLGARSPWGRLVRVRAQVHALIREEIAERRASGQERDDVLTMLLAARHADGTSMTDAELVDQLMTLLVAGHETTASQLAWACERLVRAPEVLARLQASVDAGEDDYLMATIYESLRRRPVLPNTQPRLAVQPLELGGRRYPAGVALFGNAYLLHHDPAIYPDPYAFRPERFLDEKPGTYTWIPFGGGRRRCLGASFALLEMRVVLGALLRQAEMRAGSSRVELTKRRNITVSPGDGALVALTDR